MSAKQNLSPRREEVKTHLAWSGESAGQSSSLPTVFLSCRHIRCPKTVRNPPTPSPRSTTRCGWSGCSTSATRCGSPTRAAIWVSRTRPRTGCWPCSFTTGSSSRIRSRAPTCRGRLLEIGLAVVERSDVRTRARPLLVELVEQFNETVHLMTLEGTQVRYVDAVEGSRALRVAPRTGSLLPAHCTSGGKALLAELPDDRIPAMYADRPR